MRMIEVGGGLRYIAMDLIVKIVEEELELARKRILTRIGGIPRDGNQTSAQRNMKLQFKNRICPTILTGEEIKGEDKNPLEVALVDESTGNIVEVGPESSATVEILLLKGVSNASEGEGDDWSENIVQEVEGKKPLLGGKKLVKLQNGRGVLVNNKFIHRTTKMRPSVFNLGARVVNTFDGARIKEAMTERFEVKDFRKKYYIKHETPSLSDEVSRLVYIQKGGKIQKRLQEHKICTVEDFLIRRLIDPEGLETVVNTEKTKWERIAQNALACLMDKRMYYYMNDRKTMGVVFNLLGQILGLYTKREHAWTNMLSEKHKANAEELLRSACKHWEKVERFDDESSLQEYFNGLDCPVGGHEDAQTSEMVAEASSRSTFQTISPEMNSTSQNGVEDSCSFSIDDVEIIDYASLQHCSLSWDFNSLFTGFDECLEEHDNRDPQLNGLINNMNADEYVESMSVQITRKPPKRWRQLFCVSEWFLIRRKVSVNDIHSQKRQKLG